MKTKSILIKSICLLVLTLNLLATSFAQIKAPEYGICATSFCAVKYGSPHNPRCPYYIKPQSNTPNSPKVKSVSIEQQILQSILTKMVDNMLNNNNSNNKNQTEDEKLKQQNENIERQHRLYSQNKYNDSVAQVKHKKMMSEYKTLDAGIKDLKYKGLMDEKSSWDASVVVLNEQKMLDSNTQTWVEYQKEQFKIRTEQPNYWCEKYYENLIKQDSLLNTASKNQSNYTPPKRITEVQAGDVILLDGGYAVDRFANNENSGANHTLTCIKVIKGKDGKPDKRLYMDNQPGVGPIIITEVQMLGKYKKRDLSVAGLREQPWGIVQPLNDKEAKRLWDKALELHNKNRDNIKFEYGTNDKIDVRSNLLGTNYGTMNIFNNDNMVCSETSWMLVNAGGQGRYQIPRSNSKLLSIAGVEFSPASFYSSNQYFIITPLAVDK